MGRQNETGAFGSRNLILKLARGALIAAAYIALTIILRPFSFGIYQLRVSESLCLLPVLFPEAVLGLFIGCLGANLLSTNNLLLDLTLGSGATLLAAYLTSKIHNRYLAALPPVLCNAVMVPLIISLSGTFEKDTFLLTYFTNGGIVLVEQFIVCYGLGLPLLRLVRYVADKLGIPVREWKK
ncbi:MAG TPA: hypothetical protein DCY74_07405 [Clostridiales bacterium]|jgi:uncharacterized membrane protein|nr:hypothetical protein [Clostridiales bacterium]HBE13980.1 hypothetical protein [Clostridiales bacterium]HCG35535.1 hypothetical protein [Clostridiales bacterium]